MSSDSASVHQEDADDASYVSLIPRPEGPAFLSEQLGGDSQAEEGIDLAHVYLTVNGQEANTVTVELDDAMQEEHSSLSGADAEEAIDDQSVRPGCSHWETGSPLGLQGPEIDNDYPSDIMDSEWEDIDEPHGGYASFSSMYQYRQSLVEQGRASQMDENGYLLPISDGQHPLAVHQPPDSLVMENTDYESIPFDQVSYASCTNRADQLLSIIVGDVIEDVATKMVPFADYQNADILINVLETELNQLQVHVKETEGELAEKLAEVQKHVNGLRNHVSDAQEHDYRRREKYEELINRFYEVAELTLANNETQLNKLRMSYEAYRRHAVEAESGFVINTTAYVMRFEREVVNLMNQAGLNESFHANLIKRLADDTAAFTVKQTLLNKDGNWQTVEHIYTPAHQLRFRVSDDESGDQDPFEESHEGKGVPSLYRDSPHAISMYHYQMKVDGRVVDQYTRMGAPIAYMKNTPEGVRQATLKRFKEIVVNVLVSELAEELKNAINDDSHVVKLNLCYLNLMSPDKIRGVLAKLPLLPKELKEILNDESAWVNYLAEVIGDLSQILNDGRITVKNTRGEEYRVQLQLNAMMFVMPCNKLGLKGFWNFVGNTWKVAKQINLRTLNELKRSAKVDGGIINEMFSELCKEDPDSARVWQKNVDGLIEKIARKMKKIKGKISIDEVALLEDDMSDLCALLKMHIITGCKSNKDRTSVMKSKKQSSRFDRRMRKNCLLYGGHLQIQINNTGVPGGKYDSAMLKGDKDIRRAVKRTKKEHKKNKGNYTFNVRELIKKNAVKTIVSGKKKMTPEDSDLRAPPVPPKPKKGLVPPALIGALYHDASRSSDEGDESLYEDIDALREEPPVFTHDPVKKKRARFFRRS